MKVITRRNFVKSSMIASATFAAGTAGSTASSRNPGLPAQSVTAKAGQKREAKQIKIIGICCSPRKAKTTAASLRVCLEAAKEVHPAIEVELIELAGMKIDGSLAAGLPLEPGERDDFPKLVPKLSDPAVVGIIVGTPVYFSSMTSLCKAFLDRCITFWENNMSLSGKVAGVLAVGGSRNGGQEITIQSVQAALLSQEMIIVGSGRPAPRIGATVWNSSKGDVTEDEFGMATTRKLGRRVAEVALQLNGMAK